MCRHVPQINARMGGGPVRDINLLVWGVDLVEEGILCALGIPTKPLVAPRPLKQARLEGGVGYVFRPTPQELACCDQREKQVVGTELCMLGIPTKPLVAPRPLKQARMTGCWFLSSYPRGTLSVVIREGSGLVGTDLCMLAVSGKPLVALRPLKQAHTRYMFFGTESSGNVSDAVICH